MTTIVTAAARWTGENFDIGSGDIPHWIAQAMGASMLTFTGLAPDIEITVATSGDPQALNPGGWLYLAPASGVEGDPGFIPATLGSTTDEDFTANYEIAA